MNCATYWEIQLKCVLHQVAVKNVVQKTASLAWSVSLWPHGILLSTVGLHMSSLKSCKYYKCSWKKLLCWITDAYLGNICTLRNMMIVFPVELWHLGSLDTGCWALSLCYTQILSNVYVILTVSLAFLLIFR